MNALPKFPTVEEQRRGMTAFRAKLLAGKQAALRECKLTKTQRAFLESECEAIRAHQVRLGEVTA